MRRRTILGWIVAAFAVVSLVQEARAAEFTADMTEIDGSDTLTSKIYIKESNYRMEMVEDGQEVFVIVSPEDGMTRVALVADKMYFEMPSNDMRSLMKDPFQSLKHVTSMGESTSLGTEEINGYECEKIEISLEGTPQMTQWVAKDLGFPLRIVLHTVGDKLVELSNVQAEELDDALFKVPSDYTKMEF